MSNFYTATTPEENKLIKALAVESGWRDRSSQVDSGDKYIYLNNYEEGACWRNVYGTAILYSRAGSFSETTPQEMVKYILEHRRQ